MSRTTKSIARGFSIICAEPYRLFFPLGMLAGLLGAGHWLWYGLGWTQSYSGFYHAAFQTRLYLSLFAVGFLTTAIPRFTSASHARPSEVSAFFVAFLCISISLNRGIFMLAEIFYIILLFLLILFIAKRFLKRAVQHPPTEFVWLPLAIVCGMMGSILLVLCRSRMVDFELVEIGRDLTEQGFMLSLVMGVGGFLGPRIMGSFELPNPQNLRNQITSFRVRRLFVHSAAGILFFLSFWLEGTAENEKGYLLRAVVVTAELLWTKALLFKPPRANGLFPKLMRGSFWMIVVGLWANVFFPAYHKAMLHFVFIGGFSLMIFSVATMVVLSHAGEGERLQRTLWVLRIVAFGTAMALIFRILADFSPDFYFSLLALAASSWLVMGISWLCFSIPFVLKVPDLGIFEEHHEKFKEGVKNAC